VRAVTRRRDQVGPAPPGSHGREVAVGDPARPVVGRALLTVTGLGVLVFAYVWLSKEIPDLYVQEPWREDPYDALISFMFAALPLLVAAAAVRLRLCRRRAPLPIRRVLDLLRLCWLLIAAMAVTVATEWIAVLVVRGSYPSAGPVVAFVGLLAVLTAAVAWGARLLRAASLAMRLQDPPAQPDWLADAVTLADRELARFGRRVQPLAHLLGWVDRSVVARVRRHPVVSAGVFAIGFSLAADSPQIVLEGYHPIFAAWFLFVSSCSFFAFTLAAGRYLPLIELRRRSVPAVHLALFAAALTVPLVASFRAPLSWSVGATAATLDLDRLIALTLLWALAVGLIVLAAATWRTSEKQAVPR